MNRRAADYRRAMTLVEVTLAVAVVTLLAAVAVRLLDSVLRLQESASRHAQTASDLNRLADALRRDARQTQQVELRGQRRQLELSAVEAGEVVRYTISDQPSVQRQRLRDGHVVARDAFALFAPSPAAERAATTPTQPNAVWQWDDSSGVVALQLPTAGDGTRQLPIRIEAVIAGASAAERRPQPTDARPDGAEAMPAEDADAEEAP